MEERNYDKLQYDKQEINILQWSNDQAQVSIFQHSKVPIDVNENFKYFVWNRGCPQEPDWTFFEKYF